MEKNTLNLKEIFKKHATRKLMQSTDEHCMGLQPEEEIGSECLLKSREIKDVKFEFKKQYQFKSRERVLKEDSYRNPYSLPERMRVTTKCLPPRKEKPIPFIMDEPHTICDIDPTFYEIVEGRPIKPLLDIKVYLRNIRDITLFRADAAYLKDQILQIDLEIIDELEELLRVQISFKRIKENFMRFAQESYAQAKYMQNLAEQKARSLFIVSDQLEGLSFKFVKLKNQVSNLFMIYENLLQYQNFLYTVSPMVWRDRHDSLAVVKTMLNSNLVNELVLLESPALYKQTAVALSKIPARLYFEEPSQLINVYDAMGRQCLNYIEINSVFSVQLEKLNKYRKKFETQVKDECIFIQELIEMFTERVDRMENTKDDYEAAFFRLLENEFQSLYASYDSIKLFTCVQFVHHEIFKFAEDPNDSLTTLMIDIEGFYNTLSTRIDNLDLEVVKRTTTKLFSDDIRMMKLAAAAQRHLKTYDEMCNALRKSFEAPKTRSCLTKEVGK